MVLLLQARREYRLLRGGRSLAASFQTVCQKRPGMIENTSTSKREEAKLRYRRVIGGPVVASINTRAFLPATGHH